MSRTLEAGQKYNQLTLVRIAVGSGRNPWVCLCDCGVEKVIQDAWAVRQGKTKSCGCLSKENGSRVHGQTGTPLHKKFDTLSKYRVKNMVSDAWACFETFAADMQASFFDEAVLDRIDMSAPYSKENCFWSTKDDWEKRRKYGQLKEPLHQCFRLLYGHRQKGNVCPDWQDYDAFKADMQASFFQGAVLDRHDATQPFDKVNCFWTTRDQKGWRGQRACPECRNMFSPRYPSEKRCSSTCKDLALARGRRLKRILSDEDLHELQRRLSDDSPVLPSQLAVEFGLSTSHVRVIRNRSSQQRGGNGHGQ